MATAIESMTGINIASAYFSSTTNLEFFPKHPKPPKSNRVALLYGKNGSGKSTIAQGFREYKNSINPRTVTVTPMEGTAQIKISPSAKPEKFFVFDEEYILSKVRIKNSGLDAIVLFGEQVSLEEKISQVEGQIKTAKAEISTQEAECARFQKSTDILSPKYWLEQIRNVLRDENGWADIGSRIKGHKQKLSVTDAEIERIGNLTPVKSIADLKSEFEQVYAEFSAIDANTAILSQEIIQVPSVGDIVQTSKSLLERVIAKPQLTHREQELLDLFGLTNITNGKMFLSNQKNTICDKCFQPISDDYRNEVLKQIDCILNRDVQKFKEELTKLLIPEVPVERYQGYSRLPLYEDVLSNVDNYNKSVVAHNTAVQAKIDNLFVTLAYDDSIGLVTAASSLNSALANLEKERIKFNRIVLEKSTTKDGLLALNDNIAHYSIQTMFVSLEKQKKEKNTADKKLERVSENLRAFENQKNQLDSQRKNYRIAAGEINKSLKYIFFSDKRLTIELGADQLYHLKSNGIAVNPSKVSCGERNAIALCYYFTEIAKDMDAKAKYSDEELLIIDDPISSFDIENRIGILSFLRWKMEQVLDGCATTKILLMTHDVGVMFDLEKAVSEISKHCAARACYAEFVAFQLEDKHLTKFEHNGHNEYTHLLQMTYSYAKSTSVDNDLDLVIGNVMRRALEAFASFWFKKGVEDVSLDEKVLDLLDDDNLKIYFRNLMYRLVLNNESHAKEDIQGNPETSFFSHLSSSEKKRTARDVLCFIYCLNKTHLLAHLPNAKSDLDVWSATIGD